MLPGLMSGLIMDQDGLMDLNMVYDISNCMGKACSPLPSYFVFENRKDQRCQGDLL